MLLFIAFLGFISLGLPDTLIGVAWPSVRENFGLQQSNLGLVFVATGLAYFLSSIFAGRLIHLLGVGVLLALSSALVALAVFIFSLSPYWGLFIVAAFLHGCGSGAIDSGLNYYAAQNFSARHMNWLHACFSLGATLGPFSMTLVLLNTGSWRVGYALVASTLALLALLFTCTRKQWEKVAQGPSPAISSLPQKRLLAVLQQPIVRTQVALFFFYTGIESMAGSWSYTILTESRSMTTGWAGTWVTMYWAAIVIGRVLFGFFVDSVSSIRLLRSCMCVAVSSAGLFALNISDILSITSLAVLGLSIAPIFPGLISKTPERVGETSAGHAIGFQVGAATLGVMALPSCAGFIADAFGLEKIGIFLVLVCTLVLFLHERIVRQSRI
jgi:fucose permease